MDDLAVDPVDDPEPLLFMDHVVVDPGTIGDGRITFPPAEAGKTLSVDRRPLLTKTFFFWNLPTVPFV